MKRKAELPNLTYQNVDQLLIATLPELAIPYSRCLDEFKGEHPGQYNIFEPMFAVFVEVLLAMPASPTRDKLLRRSFAFVELMQQSSDRDVRDLANISIYEGHSSWWFGRAQAFIGPASQIFLNSYQHEWRQAVPTQAQPDPEREIIDLHGVRNVIFQAMHREHIALSTIPGISSPQPWARLESLKVAKEHPDGVVFLSYWGTSEPCVVSPAREVACDEIALIELAWDLAGLEPKEPRQQASARNDCYIIPAGERVWRMRVGDILHGRYHGTLWIAPTFVSEGLEMPIRRVLNGQQPHL